MQFRIRVSATVVTVSSEDYGRFVRMHFRSRERNDHTVNVRSRERTCGRFVPGTKLPSAYGNFRALQRTECRKGVTIYNKF